MMMHKWTPERAATEPEKTILVRSVFAELKNGKPGDWTVNLDAASGTLVFGTIEGEGKLFVYECLVRSASVEAEELIVEGAMECSPTPTKFVA